MERSTTRRSVLKTASATALLGTAATTVEATGSDELADLRVDPQCTCSFESRCLSHPCRTELDKPRLVRQVRECCTCDNGTTCDYWTNSGCCAGGVL